MSIYGGFALREMEAKYNITVFDLLITLSARVAGTLRNSKSSTNCPPLNTLVLGTPEQLRNNKAEMKLLLHISKLHKKLKNMENHKRMKPMMSQAADRLQDRICELIWQDGDDSHLRNSIKEDNLEDRETPDRKADDRHVPLDVKSGEDSLERHFTSESRSMNATPKHSQKTTAMQVPHMENQTKVAQGY